DRTAGGDQGGHQPVELGGLGTGEVLRAQGGRCGQRFPLRVAVRSRGPGRVGRARTCGSCAAVAGSLPGGPWRSVGEGYRGAAPRAAPRRPPCDLRRPAARGECPADRRPVGGSPATPRGAASEDGERARDRPPPACGRAVPLSEMVLRDMTTCQRSFSATQASLIAPPKCCPSAAQVLPGCRPSAVRTPPEARPRRSACMPRGCRGGASPAVRSPAPWGDGRSGGAGRIRTTIDRPASTIVVAERPCRVWSLRTHQPSSPNTRSAQVASPHPLSETLRRLDEVVQQKGLSPDLLNVT